MLNRSPSGIAVRLGALGLALGLAILAGCGRAVMYTYSKKQVSDATAIRDREALMSTSGVKRATITPKADGSGVLELELEESGQAAGMEKAIALGYQRVRL